MSQDIGDIAVIEDDGTLLLPRNSFDVRSTGLRFERNGSGGYDVTQTTAAFRTALGSRVTLSDDDSKSQTIPFAFPYYGRSFTSLFINSDGNLTFEEADALSTTRGFARLLGGPPRVAPFFADLDPSTGGRVFVDAAADAFTVTFCGVRGFDSTQTTTVQASLFPSGAIDVKFGPEVTLAEALVAVSPGRGSAFTPVDLSAATRSSGGAAAVGERFADDAELDTAQTARRFFASHADRFDQLLFFTDTTVVTDAFAFESTIANAIRGIGVDIVNQSADFGSGGTLQSILVMDRVAKYGDDPSAKILGENSALSILGQECGHRWLAQLQFNDGQRQLGRAARAPARPLELLHGLGRVRDGGQRHRGPGRRQLPHHRRGGALQPARPLRDGSGSRQRRAAGLLRRVADQRHARAAIANRRRRSASPSPARRRDVSMADIIRAMGERQPSADDATRLHRQAWIYVITRGSTPAPADLARLDRLRSEFEQYFRRITENRMTMTTSLR